MNTLGWIVLWIVILAALVAIGVVVLGRRSAPGKSVGEQMRAGYDDLRHSLGLGASTSPSATAEGATKAELYEQAKAAEIPGRSTMTKDELKAALEDPQTAPTSDDTA